MFVSIDVELFLKYLEIPDDPLHLDDFVFEHLKHRLAVLQLGFILLFCVGGFLELQRDVFEVLLQLIYYFMSLLLRLLLLVLSIHVIGEQFLVGLRVLFDLLFEFRVLLVEP